MTETPEALFERLRPMIDNIDLKTAISPTVQGAINSASLTDDPKTGGQWVPDDEITKLAKAMLVNGKTAELKAIGLCESDQALLQRIPIERLAKVRWTQTFRLVLDTDALKDNIEKVDQSIQRDDAIDRLVRAGGKHKMLSDLFGVGREYVAARREHFGINACGRISEKRVERPKMIDHMVTEYSRILGTATSEAAARSDTFIAVAAILAMPIQQLFCEIQEAIQLQEFCWI